MIYLLLLIRDLDNPFGYYERDSDEDVSLKPLEDTAVRLEQIAEMGRPSNHESVLTDREVKA